MKSKIIVITLVLMLIGANVFAAGDLIVNGKLGVGTDAPGAKLYVVGTDLSTSMGVTHQVNNIFGPPYTWISAAYTQNITNNVTGFYFVGQKANLSYQGLGSPVGGLTALQTQVGISSASPSTITEASGLDVDFLRQTGNSAAHTITTYKGFKLRSSVAGSGNISGTNWYQGYIDNFANYGGIVTNTYGLFINKQTRGTNNYGLVLNGDGAIGDYGAAVVLGTNRNAYLYGKTDGVYVYDGTAETKISPHDPETGEWIYYSKNVKTGKTVRVDMERLVKAVEKLTGERFMVETLIDK